VALLSPPGGLYLDVKSGYSDALQLKQFASSLAGIGVSVKVQCARAEQGAQKAGRQGAGRGARVGGTRVQGVASGVRHAADFDFPLVVIHK
jgi:hypothetical protein